MEARLYEEDAFQIDPRYESYGNVARDPYYGEIAEYEKRVNVAVRPRTVVMPAGTKLLLILMAVGICAFSCFVISRYLQISKTTHELQGLQGQIDTQKKLTEDLKLELARATDLNQMMAIAGEELGMGYPSEDQFRSFTLKESQPQVAAASSDDAPEVKRTLSGWIAAIIDLLQ